ncbi:MAG: ATP-binding protein [Pseudonocardia sp.]|nr:ATP-binding protein [Pseudonocardia sp.]
MARSDAELLHLLAELESDQVERTQQLKTKKSEVAQAVCAFANDLPGYGSSGVVFIGATDSGGPAGLDVTDELLLELSDLRSDGRLLPLPQIRVARLAVGDQYVVVVEVDPSSSPPVRFEGRVRIRVGPRRAIASADEERRLSERRRSLDLTFDARPLPGLGTDALDLDLFEREYLP